MSESRSRNTRYVGPSLSVTSHSSRSHWELADSGRASSDRPSPVHHAPDVRHGPAHVRPPSAQAPPSIVNLDGLPCSTWTRVGTGMAETAKRDDSGSGLGFRDTGLRHWDSGFDRGIRRRVESRAPGPGVLGSRDKCVHRKRPGPPGIDIAGDPQRSRPSAHGDVP